MKPNDIFGVAMTRAKLFGAPLDAFIRTASRHLAAMLAVIGQPPDPANRIVLADTRDRFGMRGAKVVHGFNDESRALWDHCVAEGAAVMAAAGATGNWHAPFNAGHLLGGTVMGDDPADSVTDGFGRVHGIANLVVAGAGLFPTAGGVSPTLTVLALAERANAHLLA